MFTAAQPHFPASRNPCNLWNILSSIDHAEILASTSSPSQQLDQPNTVEDTSSDSDGVLSAAESLETETSIESSDIVTTIEDLLVDRATIEQQPISKQAASTADKIIATLYSYSPASHEIMSRSTMEELVRTLIEKEEPLHLVLPAFPFKSPNKVDKVLGPLPDMGEELALATLEGLCAQLDEIYPGTAVSIVSDGLVYNDLLGVSDEEVWNYGSQLRRLASEQFPRVSFARLSKLLGEDCLEPQTLDEYLSKAEYYRSEMVKRNLPENFDVSVELKHQINSLMTYRGYIKFLATDLKYESTRQEKSKSQVKKMNEAIAKRMIQRGAAFALAIQKAYPSSIRISIHRSESRYKLPVSLFAAGDSYTTPWHCVCALELDGSWRHAHKQIFAEDPDYELIYNNNRPWYYRRKSSLYSWGSASIDMSPLYPTGIKVTPRDGESLSMSVIDMVKIRKLAEYNSPIILRGFQDTTDLSLFTRKAQEMGQIMPWKFGEVLVVKDAGTENGGLNNVLSAEAMPMHFDGLFKTVVVKNELGSERLVPQPPNFQWFTVATPSPQSCGLTLVASSRLLFSHLPKQYTTSDLQKLTWTVKTTAFNNSTITNLDLVIPHPTNSTPCIRYHEPWPSTKTRFDPTYVTIDNLDDEEGEKLIAVIDGLLYDRRVCYYHEWIQGDLVLSDNISMMHTRTGFIPGAPRELWRIHVN